MHVETTLPANAAFLVACCLSHTDNFNVTSLDYYTRLLLVSCQYSTALSLRRHSLCAFFIEPIEKVWREIGYNHRRTCTSACHLL